VPIPFTDREMYRAWRANRLASIHDSPSNSHRLLLFYAVECGLKAVLMKRESVNCTSQLRAEVNEAQHNINKLLDALSAGQALKLPNQLNMKKINDGGSYRERTLNPGQINQMWRYGGREIDERDDEIEAQLVKIAQWIEGELGRS
jgi:hypothetical protein